MLGFPIRTPPDQRSVANSPGLIAGSNVLLRLLMPRHPPCALHSLSLTNTQQKQQTNNHTHAHHTCGQSSSLSALRRPRTHQHPNRQVNPYGQSAYKVCAFLLNKMLASTIQLSTPTLTQRRPAHTTPSSAHTEQPSSEGGTETTTQHRMLCDPSGPNSVSRPILTPSHQVPRPNPKARTVLR